MKQNLAITSATLKPGFGSSLTRNLNFKRQLTVDNLSGTPGLRVASYVGGNGIKTATEIILKTLN